MHAYSSGPLHCPTHNKLLISRGPPLIYTQILARTPHISSIGIDTHIQTPGGCGQAFKATIVSPQFTGLNSLKRHRLVNAALKDEIAKIHAWSAKCLTPEQWASESR